MKFKKAFTMAEAILVMTILGIIATIMISTLKPTEFRDQGLEVLATKIMGQIDTATTQILVKNSSNTTMDTLLDTDGTTYKWGDQGTLTKVKALYQKYMVSTRQDVGSTFCLTSGNESFMLKDGSCMGFGAYSADASTRFPGETTSTTSDASTDFGYIYLDINDKKEPNTLGKDQFLIPIGKDGILY